MDLKTVNIREYFKAILHARSLSSEGLDGTDWEGNLFVLLRNYEETKAFLTSASVEEIGCAVDVLEDMARRLPTKQAREVWNIFQKKLEEFPNAQDFCDVEYALELQIAKEIIDEKAGDEKNG